MAITDPSYINYSSYIIICVIMQCVITELHLKMCLTSRGGSRISEKGVPMYKGMGFALMILSTFS